MIYIRVYDAWGMYHEWIIDYETEIQPVAGRQPAAWRLRQGVFYG
jgi:hypothetical protein